MNAKTIVEKLLEDVPVSDPTEHLARKLALEVYDLPNLANNVVELKKWVGSFTDADWDELQQDDEGQEWGPDQIDALIAWGTPTELQR